MLPMHMGMLTFLYSSHSVRCCPHEHCSYILETVAWSTVWPCTHSDPSALPLWGYKGPPLLSDQEQCPPVQERHSPPTILSSPNLTSMRHSKQSKSGQPRLHESPFQKPTKQTNKPKESLGPYWIQGRTLFTSFCLVRQLWSKQPGKSFSKLELNLS